MGARMGLEKRASDARKGSSSDATAKAARSWAVSGSSDSGLIIWDYEKGSQRSTMAGETASDWARGKARVEGHRDRVRCVAVSRSGSWLVSGSADDTIRVWEAATGTCHRTLTGHTNSVWTVAITRDGHNVFSGAHQEFWMWDRRSGKRVGNFDGHSSWIKCCALSRDDMWIVSGSNDETLKVWDVRTGDIEQTLRGHVAPVTCCDVSSDSTIVVSGSQDGSCRMWSVSSGSCTKVFEDAHVGYVLCCCVSGDARWMLTGGADNTLKLWDTAHHVRHDQECEQTFERKRGMRGSDGHGGSVTCCAIASDGRHFMSGSTDKTLRIWDGSTGDCVQTLVGHKEAVLACAFSCASWGQVENQHSGRRARHLGSTGEIAMPKGHQRNRPAAARGVSFAP